MFYADVRIIFMPMLKENAKTMKNNVGVILSDCNEPLWKESGKRRFWKMFSW